MRRSHTVLCLPALLAACALFDVSTPQTFDERLANGVATVSAVRTTTTTLLREGQIAPDDAQRVYAQADDARKGLEGAREIHATDAAAGDARLAAVDTTLQDLQTYLNAKRPVPCMPLTC